MVSFSEAAIAHLSIHKTGNKNLDEPLVLSDQSLPAADEKLGELLMRYFVQPFEKTNEIYRLSHPTDDLALNEVFHFTSMMFEKPGIFHENTQQIAKLLYDIADNPKIKSGELYICYFKQLQLEGELLDAIGIFKSESKEPFLKVSQKGKTFHLNYEEQAINIKKLDKGCIIFNTEKEAGYKVAVIDQTNRAEAVYWIDEFLKLKVRNDNYNQTHNVLSAYKHFVTQKMDEDFDISKADKIDLLNRSIRYFKENEHFDLDEFSNVVIDNPKGAALFKTYKQEYELDMDAPIEDLFSISNNAVKKQARVFKSVLKLDKNFHIYIHGNRELIEQGTEPDGRKYYKIYFKEEH
ncbi:MAG: nucleoid-associated protein [Chitinophagaceae bacterium]